MTIARRVATTVALIMACSACGGPPPPASAGDYLEGATWHLTSVDALRVPADSDGPWLRVDSTEGRVSGFAGCNTFQGPYRAGGATVTFGPLAMTRRACPEDQGGALERLLMEVVQQADGYTIVDGRLQLMVEGRIRALFVAGPGR